MTQISPDGLDARIDGSQSHHFKKSLHTTGGGGEAKPESTRSRGQCSLKNGDSQFWGASICRGGVLACSSCHPFSEDLKMPFPRKRIHESRAG
jgi:hypothetical protein